LTNSSLGIKAALGISTESTAHADKTKCIKICRANKNSKQRNMPNLVAVVVLVVVVIVGLWLCSMLLTLSKVVGNQQQEEEQQQNIKKKSSES